MARHVLLITAEPELISWYRLRREICHQAILLMIRIGTCDGSVAGLKYPSHWQPGSMSFCFFELCVLLVLISVVKQRGWKGVSWSVIALRHWVHVLPGVLWLACLFWYFFQGAVPIHLFPGLRLALVSGPSCPSAWSRKRLRGLGVIINDDELSMLLVVKKSGVSSCRLSF